MERDAGVTIPLKTWARRICQGSPGKGNLLVFPPENGAGLQCDSNGWIRLETACRDVRRRVDSIRMRSLERPHRPGRPATEWHEFHGTWTATGSRRTIRLGDERRASIASYNGSLLLAGASRPGVGFGAEAIVLNDTATGMVGRASGPTSAATRYTAN